MGLSFNSVQRAYEIFGQLKREFNLDLRIPSWPEDMSKWSTDKKENPPVDVVLGWDKKFDNGWESIAFFIEDPTPQLFERFHELNDLGNTSVCEPYKRNSSIHIIGWF